MAGLPLQGIRVVDMGQIFSVPYAGAILADLGAEVIKVEGPGRMDSTRGTVSGVYADNEPGEDPWNRRSNFNILNRGKKSLVLDVNQPEGLAILKQLLAKSDVFMENFTPRVMRRWGLEYDDLKALNPGIVMVSNTGYGRGAGPYSNYPAQATSQEATHGLAHVTGYRNGPPSKAGAAYVDFLACWSCATGIALALRQRRRSGMGQHIDVGMYQLGCFNVSDHVLDWMHNGRLGGRIGNRHAWQAPQGCYPCSGQDAWCTLSVRTDEEWLRLCEIIGAPDLASDSRLATHAGRQAHHDQIDEAIAHWTRRLPKQQAMSLLQQRGLAAGAVLDAGDMHFDPHYAARGTLEVQSFPPERHMGQRRIVRRPWKLSQTALHNRGPGPGYGEHNRAVLCGILGYDHAQCDELERTGVIANRPLKPPQNETQHPMSERVRLGQIARFDPDYKERLHVGAVK